MTAREFEASLAAPGHARRFASERLTELLDGPPPAGLEDDVQLVVSELVTNAVRAGAATVRLDVTLTAESAVLVTVTDGAQGWPQPRAAAADDVGGRGLALVSAVAASWGAQLDDTTKTVWAELPVHA